MVRDLKKYATFVQVNFFYHVKQCGIHLKFLFSFQFDGNNYFISGPRHVKCFIQMDHKCT